MAEAAKTATAPAPEPIAPKMITWTGEDDLHYINQVGEDGTIERTATSGPSFLMWNKIRFDKDKPKLIDPSKATTHDERAMFEHILKKVGNGQLARFTVEDVEGEGEGEGETEGEGEGEGGETGDTPAAHRTAAHHKKAKRR